MTQVDAFVDGKDKPGPGVKKSSKSSSSDSGKASQSNSNQSDCSMSHEVLLNKILRVYRNGHVQERVEDVPVVLGRKSLNWPDILHTLNEAVKVPVQNVFTIYGKRISSPSELQNLNEVVVCGKEQFKMLPYGKDPRASDTRNKPMSMSVSISPDCSNKASSKHTSKARGRRHDRASLVKSVMIDPPGLSESECGNSPSNSLLKTLSEQDVSILDKSAVRVRQSPSVKQRPLSAYQQVSMTCSADRKNALGLGVSRIPKRIVTAPTSNVNSPSNNTTPPSSTVPSNNYTKPKKSDNKISPSERSSRHDSSSMQFVRPRLVTVIRHGMKPRKAIRFLLNKKTARSYDQVLNELTESVKPDWGAVRKVYTLNGSEVACLEDFFGSEDIFLVCPNDRLGTNDFDLDSEECKSIQPYVKVSLGFKQSRFKGLEASRSPHRRPKSCSNSQSPASQFPSHPKYIPLAHFPSSIVEKYYVGDIIGDGNFAVVRECTDRRTKQRFALKVIDKSKCKGRDAPAEHEVKILSMVNHPNVIELYEQYDFSNELYIVLELIEGGDLFDAIAEVTKFSEEDSASMTRDIASALTFLHSLRIIHRDIKPENLLVYSRSDGQRRIKLGDFGLAKIVDGPLYTVCGTPTYVAPEILAEAGYGLKVDIWALGVIVYVLLCGYPPFVSPTGDQEGLFDLILSAEYDFPDEHWETISSDAKDIITRMIEPDSDMRLSAEEVLEHPWLAENTNDLHERRHRHRQDFSFRVFEAMGLRQPISLSPPPNAISQENLVAS